jgi:hypothetical protein
VRLIRIAGVIAAGIAGLAGAGCEDDSHRSGGPDDFCGVMRGYISACGTLSPCESAIVRDCATVETSFATSFIEEIASCMRALGTPMHCIAEAFDTTVSSARLESFSTTICLECGSGAGPCEAEVTAGTADHALARAGRLARVLSPSLLDAVETECATGSGCADTFEVCAAGVLARSLPAESVACVMAAVLDGDVSDGCEGGSVGDTDGGDTDGSGPTSMGDTDDDPTDPTDTAGDTDGCTHEGCPCMFSEECSGELVCVGNQCTTAQQCEAPHEPNNTEAQAHWLPGITDHDSDGSSIMGKLDGSSDVDWFAYEGTDVWNAIVNPWASLNVNALELCIHAECLNGLENTDVSCPQGTTQQPSPAGRPGCCGTNTGSGFELNLSCAGWFGDDSAHIYMRVSGAQAGVCQNFTLSYHF